jgi:sec-independent protein translocase protein TatB
MFDVSFGELVVCLLVALIVLGPQKLPQVARTLGLWTGRARMYVRNLQAELERETQGSSLVRDVRDAAQSIRDGARAVQDDVHKLTKPSEPGPRGG